jgi:diacylglycerol kinase family enzyme
MLGIPRRLRRAIPMLLGGESVRMDLARFESASVRPGGPAKRLGYLAFAAGIGIDVSMITATSTAWKRRLGVAAYVVSAAHAALRRSEFDVVAEVDGTPLRQRASLAMVVNSGSLFRGAFHIGPSILADDGRLDLCVFSPKSAANVFGIAWRVWRKDFRPHPAMRYLKGTRITLLSEPPREVQADGTLIGWTPATFCVAPLAATFLVPRR